MADSDYDLTIIDQLTAPLSALLDSTDNHLRKAVAGMLVRTAVPFAECRDRKRLIRLAPDSAAGQAREYAPVIGSISSSLEPCLKMDDVEAKKGIARRLLEAGIAVLPEQDSPLCDRIAMIALSYPACAKKRRVTGQALRDRAGRFWASRKGNPELMRHVKKTSAGERSAYIVSDVESAKKAVLSLLERPACQGNRGYMPVLKNAFIEVFIGKYSVPESDAIKEANTLARRHFKDADLRACFSPVTQGFHTMQVVKKEELESRICRLVDKYVGKMGPINEAQLQAALNYINGEPLEEGQHSGKLATFYEFVHNVFSEHCRQGTSITADAFFYTKEWFKREEIKACLNGETVTKPKELKELLTPLVIDVQSKKLAGYLKKSDFAGRIFTLEEIRQLLGTNDLDQYRKHLGLLGEPRCPKPGTGFSTGYCGENVYKFFVTIGARLQKNPATSG